MSWEVTVVERREPKPSATKRGRAHAAVAPLRLLFSGETETTPASEWALARGGTGVEPPEPVPATAPNHLHRTFAFVDVCGFTAYVDRHGAHDAIQILTRFRNACREVAARRGVRVAKWLGDGVMLVGAETGPTIAAVAELIARFHSSGIDIHVGLAEGLVLLFEGDDYIGRPVNLAARLCDAAAPGEILAVVDREHLPAWVAVDGRVTVAVAGMGDVLGVQRLEVAADVLVTFGTSA